MKKRGNENSQMRAEEVEALNDEESSSGGVYTRAPPEELATRRMIKSKRPNMGDSGNFVSTEKPQNLFAGFGNAIAQTASTSNSFAGFSGLVAPPATTTLQNNPFTQFVGSVAPVEKPFFAPNLPTAITASNTSAVQFAQPLADSKLFATTTVESDYKSKMKKLNMSMLKWMDYQIVEHPLSVWKDGLKVLMTPGIKQLLAGCVLWFLDYVRYSTDISKKYSNEEKSSPAVDNVSEGKSSGLNHHSSNWMRPVVGDTKAFSGFSSNIASGVSAASASALSTNSFTGFSTTIASRDGQLPSTATATASKGVAAFNWNVPGLSAESKSLTIASTSASLPAFTFGGGSSLATATSSISAGAFGGFSVPVATGYSTDVANGDDDEGEPIMEAEKVLRHEDDKDDIICDCTCKLLRFDSGKGDNGKGEWVDVGKGNFRVTKDSVTGKQRMLVRNSVGKITFNAAFYKGMKIGRFSKVMLSFGVVVDDSGQLRNFLLKLKDSEIEGVLTSMQAAINDL